MVQRCTRRTACTIAETVVLYPLKWGGAVTGFKDDRMGRICGLQDWGGIYGWDRIYGLRVEEDVVVKCRIVPELNPWGLLKCNPFFEVITYLIGEAHPIAVSFR
jgi:hypothetical protein